jgi:fatty acid-binding protein DegV
VIITVETLEFLHRGGRIGGAQKFLATALNIKPIIEVTGGKLEGIEKVTAASAGKWLNWSVSAWRAEAVADCRAAC